MVYSNLNIGDLIIIDFLDFQDQIFVITEVLKNDPTYCLMCSISNPTLPYQNLHILRNINYNIFGRIKIIGGIKDVSKIPLFLNICKYIKYP